VARKKRGIRVHVIIHGFEETEEYHALNVDETVSGNF
jgi:hypothetical protein